jgi:cytoskeletal protein CcmA (bactofilin family)
MPEKPITPDSSHASSNNAKNFLSADVEIKGNIKYSGEMIFDGRLEGDVQTDGALQVGENAHVTGNINAQTVLARGKINGNINAKDKVEIKSRSELFGDIRAAKLIIEEGVVFVGKIEVNPNKVAPSAAAPRPGEARPGEMPKPAGR